MIIKCSNTTQFKLKWKASQLWDWNFSVGVGGYSLDLQLKWKASQLWDWNLIANILQREYTSLKWKASQLWDWNATIRLSDCDTKLRIEMKSISIMRLKQTHSPRIAFAYSIEMKSISIMRLKPIRRTAGSARGQTWNEKHLNYEIETGGFTLPPTDLVGDEEWNEKHLNYEIETGGLGLPAHYVNKWNEKHLNYEIETMKQVVERIFGRLWNEKHLNYEIETDLLGVDQRRVWPNEMKSISIMRLKRNNFQLCKHSLPMKWKASQLWDWNSIPQTDGLV